MHLRTATHLGLAVAAMVGMSSVFNLSIPSTGASSHREAPLISQDPVADATDLYAFVSPDDPETVTLIAYYYPMQDPAGFPNFYRFGDDVAYRINIDSNGDAVEDIFYQWDFATEIVNPNSFLYNSGPIDSLESENLNIRQTYTLSEGRGGVLTEIASGLMTPPVNIGPKSTPDYEALASEAVAEVGDGITVFAGQRDDPFWVDLGGLGDLWIGDRAQELGVVPGVGGVEEVLRPQRRHHLVDEGHAESRDLDVVARGGLGTRSEDQG